MRKVLSLGIALALLAGCAATSAPTTKQWHPESREEMRMLVGQTVIDAIHQLAKERTDAYR